MSVNSIRAVISVHFALFSTAISAVPRVIINSLHVLLNENRKVHFAFTADFDLQIILFIFKSFLVCGPK